MRSFLISISFFLVIIVAALILAVSSARERAHKSDEQKKIDSVNSKLDKLSNATGLNIAIPEKIVPVSKDDLTKIAEWSSKAGQYIKNYCPDKTDVTLENCDLAFKKWQAAKRPRYTKEETILILGSYLGQQCVKKLQMEWVVINDKYGQYCAVRHAKYKIVSAPFSCVEKRVIRKQYNFMAPVFNQLDMSIKNKGGF